MRGLPDELILNVLQIGRAQESRLEVCVEEVTVVEIAHSTVRAFAIVADRGGRRLAFNTQAERVLARTDGGLLRRILYHLTRNAAAHATGHAGDGQD